MKFHNNKFAEEYDRRLQMEGYPGVLVDHVKNELSGSTTVLDIGAGSGFFSIPLAEHGYRVTAVEPALPMIRLMKKKLSGRDNLDLTIEKSEWLQWSGPVFDSAICIHAIYPMEDKETSIQKMKEYAGKTVLLVRSKRKTRSMSDILRKELGFSDSRGDQDDDTIRNILRTIEVPFQQREITVNREIRFNDLHSEWEHYRFHLDLKDTAEMRVKEIIQNYSTRAKEGWIFTADHCDILFIL